MGTNSNNKNIRDLHRGINEYKKVYRSITNLVQNGNDDQLLNVHGDNDVR
jgi:hypothetical protein